MRTPPAPPAPRRRRRPAPGARARPPRRPAARGAAPAGRDGRRRSASSRTRLGPGEPPRRRRRGAGARSRPRRVRAPPARGVGRGSWRRHRRLRRMSDTVELWTDGACSGNPGPGGWAAILRWNGHERELVGGEEMTTNNRMELMSVIAGLEAISRPMRVLVHTDSAYVEQAFAQRWLEGWRRNGWKTAAKKP